MRMKKFVALLLTVCLLAACLPLSTSAADEGSITVTIKETTIHAESVYNMEGYGSLVMNATDESTQPQYALLNKDGTFRFTYGQFPCKFWVLDGTFVNGIPSTKKYSLFDLDGNQIIPESYDLLQDFFGGYAVASNKTKTTTANSGRKIDWYDQKIIDKTGKTVLTLPEGFGETYVDNNVPYPYDFESKRFPYSYGYVGGYGDGLFCFHFYGDSLAAGTDITTLPIPDDSLIKTSPSGYFDINGKVVIPNTYRGAGMFCDGLAYVIEDHFYSEGYYHHYGYIDTTGKTVIPFEYAGAGNFVGGYACVLGLNGKCGYIDKTGKAVIPLEYDDAFGHECGLFTVGKLVDGAIKYGAVDIHNHVVVPLVYDDISDFSDGVGYALKDGVVSIITINPTDSDPMPDPAPAFTDVEPGSFYEDAVKWAVENGITKGTSKDKFSPMKTCNRGQAVTFLWRAAGSPEPSSSMNPFTDVKPEDFFYKAVLWAVEKGITKGTSKDKFSPNKDCDRGTIVTFQYRAAGSPAVSAGSSFTDVSAGQFYTDAVAWAVQKGITKGTSATKFSPVQECNRGQIVTFLYRDSN